MVVYGKEVISKVYLVLKLIHYQIVKPLPGRAVPVPYVLTGNDAFGLTDDLLKPCPQTQMTDGERIFNYRLSRMRRISENRFRIFISRWRIFCTPMLPEPGKVKDIVLAALTLHNLLR